MPRCKVPYSVWLLIDFIWFLAAAILIFSDVVFDVLTCIRYFREGWYVAFAVSILLLFLPSTLIGIADYYNINIIVTDRSDKDDLKRKGKKRIRKEDVSCEHNIRLSAETLTARQVRPENEQQEILFMNSSLLTQNCSGSPNSLVQNSTFEHDVDRDLEKFANINQSEAPLAHSEGETTSLIMLENRDENNYSQSRADVSVQTEEVDGKGECRGPTYLYYRSTALPQHLSNNFLTTAPVVPRHDGRENNTENPPTEQAEGTHPEDTSDGRCESFICSRRLHLLLNIWGLQLAVFGRRFLLAVRFGQRWFRYIRFNSEQRRFHRENERKVVRGKVAYDLAENEVQQHYLDLINEDEALLPLWIIESLTESLPQLLINLYLIVKYRRQLLLQYISASLSFLTLTWGVTSPEKYYRDTQVIREGRDYKTRVGFMQLLFIFVYKALLLASRSLAFVFFTIVFHYWVIVVLAIHFAFVFFRSIFHKYYLKILNEVHFHRIVIHSIFCTFLYFHISNKKRIRFVMLQFYVVFIVENLTMILLWYFYKEKDQYFDEFILFFTISSTCLGVVIMLFYYTCVHKSKRFIVNSYSCLKMCCLLTRRRQTKEWIVCKNLPTCINCYVKRGAVALLPVKRDHIYVDHRVRPIDGQRFYFGTDTVFCACPDNVHDAAVIEGDEDVSDESKSWVKCYDAGRIRYIKKSNCFYDFIDNTGREIHVAVDNFKWYRPHKLTRQAEHI
ncbi:uncharacterized protein LOC102807952 [Saccoglossus kowalevskii]